MGTDVKYAIIEDNPFAMNHLEMVIGKLRPKWVNVFKGTTVEETVKFLQSGEAVDLLFMDIELSDGKCFKIFERTSTLVPVVFTTAYDEYALKAFKVNVVDYLMKPVTPKELGHAIDKFDHLTSPHPMQAPVEEQVTPSGSDCRILTVSNDRYSYIPIQDVAYFISEDNYVFAEMKAGGRKLLNISNLSEIEKIMPAGSFFRVSRGIITSIDAVVSASKYFRGRLLLKIAAAGGVMEITVPASRRDEFLRWLGR